MRCDSEKSPVTGACTTRLALAVCAGRPALPVPVIVRAWLLAAAPIVAAVSVQVGLAVVSGVVQPLSVTSDGALAAAMLTLPLPNAALGVSVTV